MEIYRHKFAPEISEKIAGFSSEHGGESLADFMNHWSAFIRTNHESIQQETMRLNNLGMTADVLEKMFTSARYWYTKKPTIVKEDTKDKTYVATNRAFLTAIDTHIYGHVTMKPSVAFDDFCDNNINILKKEIIYLKEANLTVDEIRTKIKKTYKNRFFVMNRVTQ